MPHPNLAPTASSQDKGKKLKPSRLKPHLRRLREAQPPNHRPLASFADAGKKQTITPTPASQVQGRPTLFNLAGLGKGFRSSKEDNTQMQGNLPAVGGQLPRSCRETGSQFQGNKPTPSYSNEATSFLSNIFSNIFQKLNQTTLHGGDAGV